MFKHDEPRTRKTPKLAKIDIEYSSGCPTSRFRRDTPCIIAYMFAYVE